MSENVVESEKNIQSLIDLVDATMKKLVDAPTLYEKIDVIYLFQHQKKIQCSYCLARIIEKAFEASVHYFSNMYELPTLGILINYVKASDNYLKSGDLLTVVLPSSDYIFTGFNFKNVCDLVFKATPWYESKRSEKKFMYKDIYPESDFEIIVCQKHFPTMDLFMRLVCHELGDYEKNIAACDVFENNNGIGYHHSNTFVYCYVNRDMKEKLIKKYGFRLNP